jgi:regulator of protease activity HflC (stomatin/prohibitin superfamily)
MKRRLASIVGALITLSLLSGCGTYEDVGLGEGGVQRLGAFLRSEGGGVDSGKVTTPGANKIADAMTDVQAYRISHTPVVITLDSLVIPMTTMKNQRLTWDLDLLVSQDLEKLADTFVNFKNWPEQLQRVFRKAVFEVISPLDLGLDVDSLAEGEDVPSAGANSFDNRYVIAERLRARTEQLFEEDFPNFTGNFHFLGVAIKNVDYPKPVLAAFERAVAESYESHVLTVEAEIADLDGQIRVRESAADVDAFAIEAASMNRCVMDYLSIDLIERFMEDENTDVTVMIPLDESGHIEWFHSDPQNEDCR